MMSRCLVCCPRKHFSVYLKVTGGINVEYRYFQTDRKTQDEKRKSKYAPHFRTMDLAEDSDKEAVRRRYIELAKQYHPDANTQNSDKFSEIDAAYKALQVKFKEDAQREEQSVGEYGLYYQGEEYKFDEEDEESEYPDIRHTAPQHRQYLEHGGFGYGTPGQRQKQYQKYRAFRANEAVFEHRIGKLTAQYEDRLATKERKTIKKHSTRNQIDRLVEDLIQESISSGEFDNLSGKGKPLPDRVDYNPYSDYTTHKMNQILVEGGFAPEWVMLRKNISDDFVSIRFQLNKKRSQLGNPPFSAQKLHEWETFCKKLSEGDVKDVNKKIYNYNLIVPMLNSQMFQFNLEAESKKIFEAKIEPNVDPDEATETRLEIKNTKEEKGILRNIFDTFFKPS